MLAVRFADQPEPRRTLLDVVRDYLRFLDADNRGLPYEARQELKRRHIAELREAADERRGSTLTEVLMAVLIMSIGLVSIAALFPISVLRTMRATQLTRATDLRRNADAMIDLYARAILSDPDVDNDTAEHVSEKYVVDPLGAIFCSTPGTFGNVPRYTVGRTTEADADDLMTCKDTEVPRLYTYLLTVRKTLDWRYAAGGEVDCVVFSRRAFSDDDERIYAATFTRGSAQATIAYTGAMKPHVKRGGYVFDADAARWYHAVQVDDDGAGMIRLALETPAIIDGTNAVVPGGIVDVFHLGVKVYRPE